MCLNRLTELPTNCYLAAEQLLFWSAESRTVSNASASASNHINRLERRRRATAFEMACTDNETRCNTIKYMIKEHGKSTKSVGRFAGRRAECIAGWYIVCVPPCASYRTVAFDLLLL